MKRLHTILAALAIVSTASAQVGEPYIHDPSTLAECEGKYYMFLMKKKLMAHQNKLNRKTMSN